WVARIEAIRRDEGFDGDESSAPEPAAPSPTPAVLPTMKQEEQKREPLRCKVCGGLWRDCYGCAQWRPGPEFEALMARRGGTDFNPTTPRIVRTQRETRERTSRTAR